MIVSILGCGWYGRALAGKLLESGIVVKGSATSEMKLQELKLLGISPYLVSFSNDEYFYNPDFFQCDIIVISIPPGFKKGEGLAYLRKVERIIETLVTRAITNVIHISSTGVYGNRNKEVDETDNPEPDSESGEILLQAETLFQCERSLNATIVRFGGLVGPGRNPARFFAGRNSIPNGCAPVNLIHQSDCVGITETIIAKKAFGLTINACAPHHPSKADFYCEMARRAKVPLPQFVDELTNWKIVNSAYLTEKLTYDFLIKSWDAYSDTELI